jgi:hypothetical protein
VPDLRTQAHGQKIFFSLPSELPIELVEIESVFSKATQVIAWSSCKTTVFGGRGGCDDADGQIRAKRLDDPICSMNAQADTISYKNNR